MTKKTRAMEAGNQGMIRITKGTTPANQIEASLWITNRINHCRGLISCSQITIETWNSSGRISQKEVSRGLRTNRKMVRGTTNTTSRTKIARQWCTIKPRKSNRLSSKSPSICPEMRLRKIANRYNLMKLIKKSKMVETIGSKQTLTSILLQKSLRTTSKLPSRHNKPRWSRPKAIRRRYHRGHIISKKIKVTSKA